VSTVCELVEPESLKQAVLKTVPPKTRDKNSIAFDRGREYGGEILKGRARQEQ
jgi:Pyruvate/2-oxoacid:ferredoxin oxidoreductase gamma subunit